MAPAGQGMNYQPPYNPAPYPAPVQMQQPAGPAFPYYPQRPPRLKLENAAIALFITGAILIGTGLVILGTAPGDMHIKEGSYEGGYSDTHRMRYSMGYSDGKDDKENDQYHGDSYMGDYYSGDALKGYNAGYNDGYYGRKNAMNDLGYKPEISNGVTQACSILVGLGVILEGLASGIRIKAHFDQQGYNIGM